jgi:arylsulfatase A-like enzyme
MHILMRRIVIFLCSLLCCSALLAAEPQPNVVVILADDAGWGDLSGNGNPFVATPHLDSIATAGARFERFYVCPVCSPTRAEFLTGRYHPRGGVWNVSTGGERLNLSEKTIADLFHTAGYATGIFGKWHNGSQYPYHPRGRGFQDFFGYTHGHWGDYFSPPLDHNGEQVQGNGFLCDDITDHAMAFMQQHRAKPFFCYVPLNTPHSPMQVPDKFYEKFSRKQLKLPTGDLEDHTRAAYAMMENIDWNVGRLLNKLAELKLTERTIVVYFHDNGPNGKRWNADLKGIKGSTDEGGIRSPLLIRWPAKIAAGTKIQQAAGAIDLFPTLAELCGIPINAQPPLDGRSLQPLLLAAGKPSGKSWPDRMLFSHWGGKVSVCSQRFRFDAQGALFDLERDPGQTTNVANQHTDATHEFQEAVAAWRTEMRLSELKNDQRPLTVGYAEFPWTELTARDGKAQGKIERSSRHPNCSYFQNWRDTAAFVTWEIEVHTAGEYEAWLDYTCAAANVGCVAELQWQAAKISDKITVAHDPPLVGPEHDRAPRSESPMKAFRPLKLGQWQMNAGVGELKLTVPTMPGNQAMDVWGVRLKLVK